MAGKKSYTCVRCGDVFVWARAYNEHLYTCKDPVQLDLIFTSLGVVVAGLDGCWLTEGRHPKITIEPKNTRRAFYVVAELTYGPCPDGLMVCHRCDDRRCHNPRHLYYGTAQDNARDSWRNGCRTMSQEQLDAMAEGLRRSDKHASRMAEHNRALAERNRGDNHWTKRDQESMTRWKQAIAAGRGGDAR
jgi:hypothetical protein